MNKVLEFLERHVQWIALGLGGLFLAYMIWTFAVQTPVTLLLGPGSPPLNPGEVDQKILDTASTPLQKAMNDPTVPEMTVPNFIDRFASDMSLNTVKPTDSTIAYNAPTVKITIIRKSDLAIPAVADIKALPVPPAAVMGEFSSGKSNVQLFAPAVPPGGAAPVVPVAASADKSWVSVGYTISSKQLAQAFDAAHIPAWTNHTSILAIQLWREETLPGDKWSDPILISPINPQSLQTLPGANPQDQQNFLTWAMAHIGDILQPVFYTWNKGDQWHAPGQNMVVVAVALPALDPAQPPPANISDYPQDQRLAYFKAHNALKNPRSGGGGRRSPGSPPPIDPNSPDAPQNQPGNPAYQPPNPGNPAQPAGAPDAAAFPMPSTGDFLPVSLTTDITGWAHDDTVVPGHTYRYRIVYFIKNPIWATNASVIPALVSTFSIASAEAQWSKTISVATTTNFFVAANSLGTTTARLKVYKWQNGVERSHVFEIGPGDMIGGKEGDVDFNTGWTLVDLRSNDPHNPGSTTVIVMDPNGILERRDYRTDQAKPELKALDQAVSAATSADQLAGGK